MANRVTDADIVAINKAYCKLKTYAAVARETGFSAATVKKYIIKDWVPEEARNIVRFQMKDLPEFSAEKFRGVGNYGDLCVLTEEEEKEIQDLWEELTL